MKVIEKKIGQEPKIVDIANTLESMQNMVGGWIEAIPVTNDGLVMFCNEEGKLIGLPPNFSLPGDTIVGDVVFSRTDSSGGNIDITENDMDAVKEFIGL